MGRGNRSCRNITNKHKTAKKYKQTENNSQPPKSTINSLPNPQAPGTRRQRCLPVRRHCSASPSVCLCEDVPEPGRVSGGLQRCHAGSLDMHVHGDTRVQKRGCIEPLCPGVKCSYMLAQWLFAAMASALSEETLPRLHEATSCLSLSAQPTGQAWLLTGVFWHVRRKCQLQMWLEHRVLGSLPRFISTAPGISQREAWCCAAALVVWQAQHGHGTCSCVLSPECTNLAGYPGKPFFLPC